ncbi:GNAT superfamily N-acetyltransferase [Nitrobacter vulgaris]|uniref:GNAT family N-acetyltransferase n=1 Tax=Nitrobacter vulgaris TaxID=29421 RepID=UPI00285C04B7|nr:GNAT family N-acetyltransferase [Nitrobacter vulgaris]MDR6304600.1 GNAT superfamily N-acetyltransferase [Nitrobacter vulgaris]
MISAVGQEPEIDFRPAVADDCRDIARFICIAGGGLYEFLFDDVLPVLTTVDLLAIGVWGDRYPISFRNCQVAVDRATGGVVGAANAFPINDLKDEQYEMVPAARRQHVQRMLDLQDWGSMFLNALAISKECRGFGVGTELLRWAQERAKANGFDRLSLHVWADNKAALEFYETRGFVVVGNAPVGTHPRLAHKGGSILMRQTITSFGVVESF